MWETVAQDLALAIPLLAAGLLESRPNHPGGGIGIGFIGAGVVQASPGEHRADGLTTAATVWAAAGIGVAAGFRHYLLAVIATGLALLVLRALKRFEGPS